MTTSAHDTIKKENDSIKEGSTPARRGKRKRKKIRMRRMRR